MLPSSFFLFRSPLPPCYFGESRPADMASTSTWRWVTVGEAPDLSFGWLLIGGRPISVSFTL